MYEGILIEPPEGDTGYPWDMQGVSMDWGVIEEALGRVLVLVMIFVTPDPDMFFSCRRRPTF